MDLSLSSLAAPVQDLEAPPEPESHPDEVRQLSSLSEGDPLVCMVTLIKSSVANVLLHGSVAILLLMALRMLLALLYMELGWVSTSSCLAF